VLVDSIRIEGLKRTRASITVREMDIRPGDTIAFNDLAPRLRSNEQLLMNTGLFSKVDIDVIRWEENHVTLKASVMERGYIRAAPNFELADRNFNVWWVDQARQLNRINIGALVYLDNITGNNDRFKLNYQYGYTQKYELEYQRPFIDRKKHFGIKANILYSLTREAYYDAEFNKQLFFRDFDNDYPPFRRFRVSTSVTYRKGWRYFQEWGVDYLNLSVADTVSQLNPDLFLNGKSTQRSFNFYYRFLYDTRDLRPYPRRGNFFELRLDKQGLWVFNDVNQLFLTLTYGKFYPIAPKWHSSFVAKARVAANRQKQPFYNQVALGFKQDYVRGYQYYVMNGTDFLLLQGDLHLKILDFTIQSKLPLLNYFRYLPAQLYIRTHADAGFAYNKYYTESNPLDNTFLFGTGISLDAVLAYRQVFQVDFTFNARGEYGFFLRYSPRFN
jgi:outer membrane protein assembly factor BamA